VAELGTKGEEVREMKRTAVIADKPECYGYFERDNPECGKWINRRNNYAKPHTNGGQK
jgi:hypothetical protein